MLESIPVTIIERIEVIKGPGSVLYGSGAMTGVINVITEKPEKTSVTATALAGNGAADTSGKVSVKNGDLGILVAGQYRQNPQWNTQWDYKTLSGSVVHNQVSIPDRGPGG